jgi:hypothetical protein
MNALHVVRHPRREGNSRMRRQTYHDGGHAKIRCLNSSNLKRCNDLKVFLFSSSTRALI